MAHKIVLFYTVSEHVKIIRLLFALSQVEKSVYLSNKNQRFTLLPVNLPCIFTRIEITYIRNSLFDFNSL